MNKPSIPQALAGVAAAASAFAAYPAAADGLGAPLGVAAVTLASSAVYLGWHLVGYNHAPNAKIAGASVAVLFATLMGVSTYHSNMAATWAEADAKANAQADRVADRVDAANQALTQAAKEADALYNQQEQARMTALANVTAELRATSKTKAPVEYANLQKQVAQLSTPTERKQTASQAVSTGTATLPAPTHVEHRAIDWYQAGIAGLFEVLTPALLILGGFFSGGRVVNRVDTKADTSTTTVNPVENRQPHKADTSTTTVTPVDALAARQVPTTNDGYITMSAVMQATGCTERQARTAITKATEQGILIKTGEGGATRYHYAKQTLRVIK